MTAFPLEKISFGFREPSSGGREIVAVRAGVPVTCGECGKLVVIPYDVSAKRTKAFRLRAEKEITRRNRRTARWILPTPRRWSILQPRTPATICRMGVSGINLLLLRCQIH